MLLRDWLLRRVLELTYTSWDLKSFADDCGDPGAPYLWQAERRFVIRSEIDAAYFYLYGISRGDTEYIMDTFPVVRDAEERACGEFRTQRVILEIYDALAKAAHTGRPYLSPLGLPTRAK